MSTLSLTWLESFKQMNKQNYRKHDSYVQNKIFVGFERESKFKIVSTRIICI